MFLIAAAFDGTISGITSAGAAVQLDATNAAYLIGRGPCVAIEEGRAVNAGAHLLAIAGNRSRLASVKSLARVSIGSDGHQVIELSVGWPIR